MASYKYCYWNLLHRSFAIGTNSSATASMVVEKSIRWNTRCRPIYIQYRDIEFRKRQNVVEPLNATEIIIEFISSFAGVIRYICLRVVRYRQHVFMCVRVCSRLRVAVTVAEATTTSSTGTPATTTETKPKTKQNSQHKHQILAARLWKVSSFFKNCNFYWNEFSCSNPFLSHSSHRHNGRE